MPKVSVVVPVYGVEKYMERCARSLFEQTLDDMEFIFVDDCTPDSSMEILEWLIDEYRHRFVEMKYAVKIEKMPVNSGLAIVRRRGVQLCTGDYIIHCDSDDYVHRDIYRKMYERAIAEQADVVVCDFALTDGDPAKTEIMPCCSRTEIISCHSRTPVELVENCLLRIDSWSLCNKLFRKSAYLDITYPLGAMGEDMVCVMQLLRNCDTISYIDEPLYYYFCNPNSITKFVTKDACVKKFGELYANSNIVIDFLRRRGMTDRMKCAMVTYKNFVRSALYPLVWDREYYRMWNDIFPDLNREVIMSSDIPVSEKIRVILTILHLYPRRRHRAM